MQRATDPGNVVVVANLAEIFRDKLRGVLAAQALRNLAQDGQRAGARSAATSGHRGGTGRITSAPRTGA